MILRLLIVEDENKYVMRLRKVCMMPGTRWIPVMMGKRHWNTS